MKKDENNEAGKDGKGSESPSNNTTGAQSGSTETELQPGEIKLSDGRIARIREGRGKDAREATMECEGNQNLVMFILMAKCITIDEKPIVWEDLDLLTSKDYMVVMAAFSEKNV